MKVYYIDVEKSLKTRIENTWYIKDILDLP